MTNLRRPPGRYDEPLQLPRAVLVTGASLLGLLLLVLTYLAFDRYTSARTTFGLLGYRVVSDTEVEVRFEVRKALGDTVMCALVARDADKRTVGTSDVTVGPAERDPVAVTERFTTTARASTVDVVSCSAPTTPH
jgi:hypothetical protein